jgi:hypothetical protein
VIEVGADLFVNRVDSLATYYQPLPAGPFGEDVGGTFIDEIVASTPRGVLRGGAGLAWTW